MTTTKPSAILAIETAHAAAVDWLESVLRQYVHSEEPRTIGGVDTSALGLTIRAQVVISDGDDRVYVYLLHYAETGRYYCRVHGGAPSSADAGTQDPATAIAKALRHYRIGRAAAQGVEHG